MTSSIQMEIIEYSEKAIVVQGDDTRVYKDCLKSLGGKYNGRLRTGPGWIFPKHMKNKVQNAINSGFKKSSNSSSNSSSKDLINMVIKLTNKVDNLENLVKKLLKNSNIEEYTEADSSDSSDSSDDETVKPKRLLHRKKNV